MFQPFEDDLIGIDDIKEALDFILVVVSIASGFIGSLMDKTAY